MLKSHPKSSFDSHASKTAAAAPSYDQTKLAFHSIVLCSKMSERSSSSTTDRPGRYEANVFELDMIS